MEWKELKPKLEKVKALIMDVDGTLTDASMYYSASGEELKRFSTRDGMGVTLLHKSGIKTGIITSEKSQIALSRAKKLGIENVIIGSKNKRESLKDIAEKLSIELENIAYIGDDVNDIQAIASAGVSACPADAAISVKDLANYICSSQGGKGAVREFAELILKSQNKSIILPENW